MIFYFKGILPAAVLSDPESINAPCIKVSSSTNEMNQVLESGNSLEVVFNEDLMTRKSGGNVIWYSKKKAIKKNGSQNSGTKQMEVNIYHIYWYSHLLIHFTEYLKEIWLLTYIVFRLSIPFLP